MKRTAIITSTLLCSGLILGAVSASPSLVNAATYYETTTKVDNPQNGDLWYRNVGDGTDMLTFENGEWTLSSSSSARRQAASDAANQDRQAALDLQQSYIGQAEANPEQYTHMLSSQTETILVIDGKTPQPYLTIPKINIPDLTIGSTYVSDEVPVMLSVIGSTATSTPATDTSTTTETTTTPADTTSTNASSTATDSQTGTDSTIGSIDIGKIDVGSIPDDLGMGDLNGSDNSSSTDKTDTDTAADASTPDVISGTGDNQAETTEENSEDVQTATADKSTTQSSQGSSATSATKSNKAMVATSKTSSTPTKSSNSKTNVSTGSNSETANTPSSATDASTSSSNATKETSSAKSTDDTLPDAGERRSGLALIGLTTVAFMAAMIGALNLKRL